MNLEIRKKMPNHNEVKNMYPLSDEAVEIKAKNDAEIAQIFTGESDRLILIIGPCSADREDAVLDYVSRLARIQEEVKDEIKIIPRVYTNKPRTTGAGYKGMLHQPNPNEAPDMLKGIIACRKMHMKALEETGLSGADEMLYPDNHLYLNDLLSYVAVGARSVENQQHRLMASAVDVPVGMKNPTSGDLTVMMNSITAGQHPHVFVSGQWEVQSKGNPLTHAILRGSVNRHGITSSNYHYEDLRLLHELYSLGDYKNPSVIVDTNHSNSGKIWYEQPRIAKDVLNSTRYSEDIRKMVKGLMIESYIVDGNQKPGEGVYGKSITDACIGWDKTAQLIRELADIRAGEKA